MAHSLSSKKRVRQNIKRKARNRARKDAIKQSVKAFQATLDKGDAKAAAAQLGKTASVLQKVASKHTIHKKTAARKRSRLAKRLNALKAKAGK